MPCVCTKQAPRVCRQEATSNGGEGGGFIWPLKWPSRVLLGFGRSRCTLDCTWRALRENKVKRTVASDRDAGVMRDIYMYFISCIAEKTGGSMARCDRESWDWVWGCWMMGDGVQKEESVPPVPPIPPPPHPHTLSVQFRFVELFGNICCSYLRGLAPVFAGPGRVLLP